MDKPTDVPAYLADLFPKSVLWKTLSSFIYGYRWRIGGVLFLLGLATISAMLIPYLIKIGIDSYLIPAFSAGTLSLHYEGLLQVAAIAIMAVIVGYIAEACYTFQMQTIGQHILNALRNTVYQHTLRLPRAYFDDHPVGGLLTRVTSDIETLDESLNSNALHMITELLKGLAFLSMMLYLSWQLTVVIVLMLPVLALMIRFFQVRIRIIYYKARQALATATGYLQECLSGIKVVQLLSMENHVLQQFMAYNFKFYRAQNTSNLYDALLYSLVEGITFLTLGIILWYAAGDLLTGTLTVGVLVAFMEYIQKLFVPIREFSQQLAIVQRALAALSHIEEVYRVQIDPAEEAAPFPTTPNTTRATRVHSVHHAIPTPSEMQIEAHPEQAVLPHPEKFTSLTFRDVSFAYRSPGEQVLKGVSFTLAAGETLAIVGATGSGKTTLIRLLQRAYHGYQGEILLNGRELSTYHADQLYQMIAVVHQEVFLFRESVAFNISMNRPQLSQTALSQAAQYVHAHHFIEALPERYQFKVASGGNNLSAGQSQLLCFARAVVSRSDLVILDEATSAVDSQTEQHIQNAIAQLHQDKTVIAIAHRLGTIRNAQRILVMDQGQIVEQGNHQSLLAQKGLYARLITDMEA